MTKTAARYSWQEARAHDRTNGYCRAQKAGGDSLNLALLLLLKTPSICPRLAANQNMIGRMIAIGLSLSETYALKYWWCSPPRTGIASGRPTVWTARGIGASLCSDRCVRASL